MHPIWLNSMTMDSVHPETLCWALGWVLTPRGHSLERQTCAVMEGAQPVLQVHGTAGRRAAGITQHVRSLWPRWASSPGKVLREGTKGLGWTLHPHPAPSPPWSLVPSGVGGAPWFLGPWSLRNHLDLIPCLSQIPGAPTTTNPLLALREKHRPPS